MKQVLIATACAALLAGCATTYTMTPLASPEASLTWDRGKATMVSDKPLGAVRVRTAGIGEKGRLVFEVAARNKAAAPTDFGQQNIVATDAAGKPLRLFTTAQLEQEARRTAGLSRASVALLAVAGAASADAAATTTTEKTVKVDGKEVVVTEKVYDARMAEALRQAALDRADIEIARIEQSLDLRLAALNDGHRLEITTLPPGDAYGGEVIAARPKGDGDTQALSLQVLLNGEAHNFRFSVDKVR